MNEDGEVIGLDMSQFMTSESGLINTDTRLAQQQHI